MVIAIEPEEIKLEIDDSVSRLALLLIDQMDMMSVAELARLESLLSGFAPKRGRALTGSQVHRAFAHIGCMYVSAIKAAREKRGES